MTSVPKVVPSSPRQGVKTIETQRPGQPGPSSHHDDERRQPGDRAEQPLVLEESLVALSGGHGPGAEDRAGVERRQLEVRGDLRPPQKRGGDDPHDPADG